MSFASNKAKLSAQNFSKTLILMNLVSLYQLSLKLHNISITPKKVKKIITNLDSSKVSNPDYIPVVVRKNCQSELSYILAEPFIGYCYYLLLSHLFCTKKLVFQTIFTIWNCKQTVSWLLYLRMFRESSTAKSYCGVSLLRYNDEG